jgi:hypothetical protein
MLRTAAAVALALVAVSGCTNATKGLDAPTSAASTITATPSTGTPSPTRSATSEGVALVIPGTIKGEVSRTVLRSTEPGTVGGDNVSSISDPVKGRSYVVLSACTAPAGSAVALTYRLADGRASSANQTPEERTVMSSQTPCDGQQHVNEVGRLAFPVVVEYDGTPSGIDTAYTVVAPR